MNLQYVECPDEYLPGGERVSVFLAGGITGCPDWQQEVVRALRLSPLTLINPRRKDFPMGDPSATDKQVQWEFRMLRATDVIAFWFPEETVCPITLYELGAWSMTNKPLVIGVHPKYPRRQDVEVQTSLARPGLRVFTSLSGVVEGIRACGPPLYAGSASFSSIKVT